MRVTSQTLHQRALHDLDRTKQAALSLQNQISSGKRLQRPSDDPQAAHTAVLRRTEVARLEQHQENAARSVEWVQASDTAMQEMSDVLHRVRELVVQGANSATGPAGRRAIAVEVRQLTEHLKETANAKVGDQFLFAGTATQTRPYGAADAYLGDTGVVAREVGPGVAVQVNTLGATLLGSGQAANDDRLLHVLRDVADHLDAGDVGALGGTDLQRLSTNLDLVSSARAVGGATQRRLESASTRLGELHELAVDHLGDLEDTDYGKAALDLNAMQTAYQAALRSAAQIVQPSLLDFLR